MNEKSNALREPQSMTSIVDNNQSIINQISEQACSIEIFFERFMGYQTKPYNLKEVDSESFLGVLERQTHELGGVSQRLQNIIEAIQQIK